MPADRDRAHLRRADRRAGYDWVVVTSPNGADEIARRGRNLPKVAAVGPGTAEALRAHGIEPAFVPVESSQDGLLREFPRPPGRVLFAAAEGARRAADRRARRRLRPALPHAAARAGAARRRRRRARLRARPPARTPASAARRPPSSIGPETSRVARSVGLTVAGEAASHDLDGLVAAVADLMDSQSMTVITFLTDFGLAGRLRRHLPRGDRAHRAGRARDRHHARHRAAGGAPGRARAAQHDASTCRSACTSPSSTRASAANAARSRCARVDGRVFVGPDNGLLMLAADAVGIDVAHELVDERYRLPERLAHLPRARHLRAGRRASRGRRRRSPSSGRRSSRRTLVRVDVAEPQVGRTQISATVLAVDRFGNVATNARRRAPRRARRRPTATASRSGSTLDRYYAVVAGTFADAPPGELIVYEDSYGSSRSRSAAATPPG